MKSVTITVLSKPVVDAFGVDDGPGFPFLDISNLTDGTDYQLYRSTDLQLWIPVGSVITAGVTGMATFTDPDLFDSVSNPEYYYQVRSQ